MSNSATIATTITLSPDRLIGGYVFEPCRKTGTVKTGNQRRPE